MAEGPLRRIATRIRISPGSFFDLILIGRSSNNAGIPVARGAPGQPCQFLPGVGFLSFRRITYSRAQLS